MIASSTAWIKSMFSTEAITYLLTYLLIILSKRRNRLADDIFEHMNFGKLVSFGKLVVD